MEPKVVYISDDWSEVAPSGAFVIIQSEGGSEFEVRQSDEKPGNDDVGILVTKRGEAVTDTATAKAVWARATARGLTGLAIRVSAQ